MLRALHILRDEGLLDFQRGRGISVAGTPQQGLVVKRIHELVEFCRLQGYRQQTRSSESSRDFREPIADFRPNGMKVLDEQHTDVGQPLTDSERGCSAGVVRRGSQTEAEALVYRVDCFSGRVGRGRLARFLQYRRSAGIVLRHVTAFRDGLRRKGKPEVTPAFFVAGDGKGGIGVVLNGQRSPHSNHQSARSRWPGSTSRGVSRSSVCLLHATDWTVQRKHSEGPRVGFECSGRRNLRSADPCAFAVSQSHIDGSGVGGRDLWTDRVYDQFDALHHQPRYWGEELTPERSAARTVTMRSLGTPTGTRLAVLNRDDRGDVRYKSVVS